MLIHLQGPVCRVSHPQGVSSGGAPPRLAVSCPTCASFPGYSWRRVKAARGRAPPDLQLENGRGAPCWGVLRGGPRALCPGRAISGRPETVEGGPGLSAFLPLDSPVTPPLGTVSACSDPWWSSSLLTAPHRPGGHRALAEGRGSGHTARSVGRWLSMGAPVKATWPPATLPGLTWDECGGRTQVGEPVSAAASPLHAHLVPPPPQSFSLGLRTSRKGTAELGLSGPHQDATAGDPGGPDPSGGRSCRAAGPS